MDISYFFILFGTIFVVIESFLPGLYFAVFGIAILVYGILLLFAPTYALPIAFVAGIGTIYILKKISNMGDEYMIVAGTDALVGQKGIVTKKISEHEFGRVNIQNTSWQAKSVNMIDVNEEVIVKKIDGTSVVVEKLSIKKSIE